MKRVEPKVKVYAVLRKVADKFHFAPLEEGPGGVVLHKNPVLMALNFLLARNAMLIGAPGWGKTTGVKTVCAMLSGQPYDLLDATEVRGHPGVYEEKVVGRLDYAELSRKEVVRWQKAHGPDALIIDEVARIPVDAQSALLQGIDTGVWTYLNAALFEGKKPTFMTMNQRDADQTNGHHKNGLLDAINDRVDLVLEEKWHTSMRMFSLSEARERRETELCRPELTQKALTALGENYEAYKNALAEMKRLDGHLTREEIEEARAQIFGMGFDVDAMLFLNAFNAEINLSNKYGVKRPNDPVSDEIHDKTYAGVEVHGTFSPRSQMGAIDFAKAVAWFLGSEEVQLDHVSWVLPHIVAHKLGFTEDFRNRNGNPVVQKGNQPALANDTRNDDEEIHLAKMLVKAVERRYYDAARVIKNLIADIQSGSEAIATLDPNNFDHPLMKDIIHYAKGTTQAAFYGE